MLPFDNKNEFQVLVDLPEGTPVEQTDAVLKELADTLRTAPEVTEILTFAGTASPMDFNGLVRHYYLRREPHRGDLRVNLISKEDRAHRATRSCCGCGSIWRRWLVKHARPDQNRRGPAWPAGIEHAGRRSLSAPGSASSALRADARHIHQLFADEPGVVDVDDTFEAERAAFAFQVDKEKASLAGISTEHIAQTAANGAAADISPGEGSLNTSRAGSRAFSARIESADDRSATAAKPIDPSLSRTRRGWR